MLRIRFSRTGKVGQPSFRIVVAEHSAPVKGRYIELVGNYLCARKPKITTFNKERVLYWVSKGAIPTDSVAALLKKEGMTEMDKYLRPRNRQRKGKGEEAKKAEEAKKQPAAAAKPAEPTPA
ncbi:MAG: 30S ribosomal protein S16 [Candidatus Gracilibacteria bacterium]|jgi:small subunit ribosomal protein S16